MPCKAGKASISNRTFISTVIPAKAGIRIARIKCLLDSRFRGNDGRFFSTRRVLFPLLVSLQGIAGADALSELDEHWRGKLEPVVESDLSGAESHVRDMILTARKQIADHLAKKETENPAALAQAYGRLGALYDVHSVDTPADQAYRNAMSLEPTNFRWAYYSAYLAQTRGRLEEALQRLKKAEPLRPDYPPLQLRMGQLLLELNRMDEAVPYFNAAAEHQGLKAAAHFHLGQIALLRRDYPQAITYLESALELDPDASSIHYPLAQALRATRQAEKARDHLRQHGKKSPQTEDPLVAELEALNSGARPIYEKAMAAARRYEFDKAAEIFARGLAIDPDNVQARVSFARSLYLSGNTELGEKELRNVLERSPDHPLAAFLLGTIAESRGDEQTAGELYKKALAADPQHDGAHYFLAHQAFRTGRFAEAAEHYQAALRLDPDNIPARLLYLVASQRSGDDDSKLAESLERALTAHPDSPVLRYALIRLLAASNVEQLKNSHRALDMARELLDKNNSPPALEAMALALASNGDFDQAAGLMRQLSDAMFWMGRVVEVERLGRHLASYESGLLPLPAWPEDDPAFMPPPQDPSDPMRDYPAPVPY